MQFWLSFRFKSKCGCKKGPKIVKLYFIFNIMQLSRGKILSQILYHYWTIPLTNQNNKFYKETIVLTAKLCEKQRYPLSNAWVSTH